MKVATGASILAALLSCFPAVYAGSHYICVIDAGSTGSRAHVFKFETVPGWKSSSTEEPRFRTLGSKRIEPGLHSFAGNNDGLEKHIGEVIEFLETTVPQSHLAKTPVFVWATAGMRLLGEEEVETILKICRSSLEKSPLLFDRSFVRVITGGEEALLTWIAINFLNGNWPLIKTKSVEEESTCNVGSEVQSCEFESSTEGNLARIKRVGIIEMGGASMQVALPMPKNLANEQDDDVKAFYLNVTLAGHHMTVYARSYLHYGMREAQKMFLDTIERSNEPSPCHTETETKPEDDAKRNMTLLSLCSELIESRLTAQLNQIPSLPAILSENKNINSASGEEKNIKIYATENFRIVLNFFLRHEHPWSSKESGEPLDAEVENQAIQSNPLDSYQLNKLVDAVGRFCMLSLEAVLEAYTGILERRLKRYCFAGVYVLEVLEAVLGTDLIAGENLGSVLLIPIEKIGEYKVEWVIGATVWAASAFENTSALHWEQEGFSLRANNAEQKKATSLSSSLLGK